MDRIRFVTALFVIYLVSDVSSSAFRPKFRKLAGSDSETSTNSSTQELPIPSNSPVPGANLLNSDENGGKLSGNKSEDPQVVVSSPPKAELLNAPEPGRDLPISKQSEEKDKQLSPPPPPANTEKKDKQLSPPPTNTKESEGQSSPPPTNSKEADTKLSPSPTNITKENATQLSPPTANTKETDKQSSPEEKEKKLTPPRENCDGKRIRCQIPNTISACVQNPESESKEWVIIVQNDVEEDLKVDLIVPTSVEDYKQDVSIPKHQIKEINVPRPSSNITLSTKKQYCNLELDQPAQTKPQAIDDWMLHLPTTELLTPINGAYLLIFTVVTLGGIWACCKCRKRKRHDSVGYQELQMASPETAAAAVVDSAEGWDQVWDDDWDEESAVKSPGHRISANGLTSRTAKKDDGWEDDWDA